MPNIVSRIASTLIAIFVMGLSSGADAATMFNVTNLGTDYTFVSDSTGYLMRVTGDQGGGTYTFDKYEASGIYGGYRYVSSSYYQDNPNNGNRNSYYDGAHQPQTYVVSENKYMQLTYTYYSISYSHPEGYSTSEPLGSKNGAFYVTNGNSSPVSDFNIHGEVVGQFNGGGWSNPSYNFAATSTLAGNLDAYISTELGIHLTDALKVDDFGRIIAQGIVKGKTDYFLLTPTDLPSPAPEPSTLAIMAVGLAAIGIRAARRRFRRI